MPDLRYIAYQGTTATKVGWKEDFNMAFNDSVPAHFLQENILEKELRIVQVKFV